jgi:hypothetical protein
MKQFHRNSELIGWSRTCLVYIVRAAIWQYVPFGFNLNISDNSLFFTQNMTLVDCWLVHDWLWGKNPGVAYRYKNAPSLPLGVFLTSIFYLSHQTKPLR